MPFKKPPTRTRTKLKELKEQEQEEKVVDSEISSEVWSGFAILGSLIITAGILLFSAPHTYAAKKVHYSNYDLANGALSSGLLPEVKKQMEAKLGVDFRLILRRANQEQSPAMQRVARACLPSEPFQVISMPDGVHKAFAHATDYLICAMKTEQDRFCNKSERERLVEQLIQYRDRQQNALALERARDKIMAHKFAQYQIEQTRKVMDGIGQTTVTAPPRVGKDIDQRIKAGIESLVKAGYLSATDFGWMGLYLPEEYVDVLNASVIAQPRCK